MNGLVASDIQVHFGGLVAVDGAGLEAPIGRITGLIGPNGAGKTTTFNVCCGFLRPNGGTVLLDGVDITHASAARRARLGLGRTFQRLEAFGSLSVRDNVRAALDIHRGVSAVLRSGAGDVDALLERVGIADSAHERADSIPTGTARLLELARCLATRPRLLLLDEPSSGLDEAETDAFGELLAGLTARGLADKVTIVVAADHGEEFAEHGVLKHRLQLYDESLHVPLVIVAPGRTASCAEVTMPASAIIPKTVRFNDRRIGNSPGGLGRAVTLSADGMVRPAVRLLIAWDDSKNRHSSEKEAPPMPLRDRW